jgi:hypothetical protein
VLPAELDEDASAGLSEDDSAGVDVDVQPRSWSFKRARVARRRGRPTGCLDRGVGGPIGDGARVGSGRETQQISPVRGARECPISSWEIGPGSSTRVPRSCPPKMTLAKGHAGGMAPGRRRLAARHVAPVIWTAAPTAVPTGLGAKSPHSTQRAANCLATTSARSQKRCRQERTVRSRTSS